MAALLVSAAVFAQGFGAETPSVRWEITSALLEEGVYRLSFKGEIERGQHIYGLDHPDNPVSVEYTSSGTALPKGPLKEASEATVFKGERVFFHEAVFTQDIQAGEGTIIEAQPSQPTKDTRH